MLKISKMTDYGIVIMHHLAGNPEITASATDIARHTHINLPTVSNILKTLAEHKLVTSQRGASGGYKLAKAANEISIADVIDSIEGPIHLTECSHEINKCNNETHCRISNNWQIINQAIANVLKQFSLIDLQHPINEHPVILNNLKIETTVKHD